jgi:2-keto-4-pentenoate hydratase/2-oxohepta-3-ene-1,7-dioic acid hydratase in catechol pathway
MTARNLQDKVRKQGLPWSAAKGFDTFTPVGSIQQRLLIFLSFSYPLAILSVSSYQRKQCRIPMIWACF